MQIVEYLPTTSVVLKWTRVSKIFIQFNFTQWQVRVILSIQIIEPNPIIRLQAEPDDRHCTKRESINDTTPKSWTESSGPAGLGAKVICSTPRQRLAHYTRVSSQTDRFSKERETNTSTVGHKGKLIIQRGYSLSVSLGAVFTLLHGARSVYLLSAAWNTAYACV